MKSSKSKKIFLITAICFVAGALAVSLVITLTHNTSDKNRTNDVSQCYISKNHFYKVYSDDFTVDADIPESYNDKANIFNATIKQFDDDVVSNVFFKGTVFEKLTGNGNVIYYPTKELRKDPKSLLPNLSIPLDGSQLHYYSYELRYPEFATFVFKADYEYHPDMTRFSDAFKKDSLSFMSKKDALAAVTAEMKKLNVDVPDTAEIYALDYQSLQSYWDKNRSKLEGFTLEKDEVKNFTQEHEFYAIRFKLEIDDIPIAHDSYVIKKTNTPVTACDISVYYAKSGIIGMDWWGLYDIQGVAESPKNIITPKDAFDKAFEAHNAMEEKSKVTIKEAHFEYSIIPDIKNSKEFKLVPSWVLVYSSKFRGHDAITAIHVNAVTGDVLDKFIM